MQLIILAFAFLGLALNTETTYRALDMMMAAHNEPISSIASVPGTFLLYRAELLYYVDTHPGFSGTVAITDLGFTESQIAALGNGSNRVIRNGGSTTIEAWVPMSQWNIERAVANSYGDLAIGSANGTSWISPIAGNMGTLPVPVAAGNAVSVVTLTGSNF